MGEALKSFKQALELDPKWAPALVGIAQTLADEDPPAAAESANKALAIDPGLAEAHLLLAQLDLDNTRYDDARNRINRVLEGERRRPGREVPCSRPSPTSRSGRDGVRRRGSTGARHQPEVRRALPGGRRPLGAQLPVRRGGGADPRGSRARPVEHACPTATSGCT